MSILPRSKLSLDDQQVMADQVTIERLEYLYSQATEAWRESRKDQSLTKRAIVGAFDGTVAVRTGEGHAALLVAAAKVVVALGKYQTQCVERRAKALAQAAHQEKNTPVRDCSTGASERVVLEGNCAAVDAANDCLAITSGESKAETVSVIPTESRSARPVHGMNEEGGRGVTGNGDQPAKPKPR